MELVAFLGKDKENWGQISALVSKLDAEKIIIVKNKNVDNNEILALLKKCEIININSDKSLIELKGEMLEKLKEKIGGSFEVALSLASGNGKEHMALISALLSIPVGVKLVAFTREGIEFVN